MCVVKCVRSNGQGHAVKQSSNKNDGQNFLTPVTAVTTAPMEVTTPCAGMPQFLNLDTLRSRLFPRPFLVRPEGSEIQTSVW